MAIPIELFRFRVARNNQEQRPQGEKLGIAQRQRVARQSNQLLSDDWTEHLGADEWSALKLNLAGSLAGAFAGRARSGARPNGRSAMPFPIGRSLSRGHDRSSLHAAVTTFYSLSKFPLLPCGAIAFLAGVALGMSGPASAAVLAVSYSATGEVDDPDSHRTPIDVQNTASDSTAGKSRSVSIQLNNKTFSTVGAAGNAFASAHAAYGELGVHAFASGVAEEFHAQAGFTTEATASFSDAFTFGWNDPKNFGKPVVVQSNILLDGGFTHSNVYEASSTFPPNDDYVRSLTISELFIACSICGPLGDSGLLGKSTHIADSGIDPGFINEEDNPPKRIEGKLTVPSGVAIPLTLTLDVRSSVSVTDFDFFKPFTGEAVADAAFTKTLALGPLTFIDPSTGLALSETDFSLVSDSGYDYLHPAVVLEPPAVPEPPIYVLLLCGLLAMWVTATNMRRVRT
jgi:hypothetical protein